MVLRPSEKLQKPQLRFRTFRVPMLTDMSDSVGIREVIDSFVPKVRVTSAAEVADDHLA